MPLDTTAIATVAEVKAGIGLTDSDIIAPAIRVWTDGVSGETAATAQVLASGVLTLVITGGANAGTTNITLSSFASLTALNTEINTNATGWNSAVIGIADADPADLYVTAALTGLSGAASAGTLDIVDNESVALAVNRATLRVESFLDRRVVTRAYTTWRDRPPRSGDLFLDNMPVTSVTRIAYRGQEALRIECTSTDASGAYVRVRNYEGENRLFYRIIGGADDTSGEQSLDLTAAANDTVGEVATVLSAVAGLTATAASGMSAVPSTDLIDVPAWDILNLSRRFGVPWWSTADYWLDEGTGGLHFSNFGRLQPDWGLWSWGPSEDAILVEYRAGWRRSDDTTTTEADFVPHDIRAAVIELVRMERARNRTNPLLKSESRGGYSYTKDTMGGSSFAQMERRMLSDLIGKYRIFEFGRD